MKPLRVQLDLTLSPAKVRALIALAGERYTVPKVLSPLDRQQLARRGAAMAVERATGAKR